MTLLLITMLFSCDRSGRSITVRNAVILILWSGGSGDEAASAIVFKIHEKLVEIMNRKGWPVTASIGLVTYVKPPQSYDEMLKKVDGVMYQVKQSGKNSVKQEVIG